MTYFLDTEAIAFNGDRRIAAGKLADVALAAKAEVDRRGVGSITLFDSRTSLPIDLDFRGSPADVVARLALPAGSSGHDSLVRRGPGRPKLGVVPREVTLLPRHWEWLGTQPGGASAALRRLVDEARRIADAGPPVNRAREVVYRFMSPMAGNRRGYEEAVRALYRGDGELFESLVGEWPADIRDHLRELAATAFEPGGSAAESLS